MKGEVWGYGVEFNVLWNVGGRGVVMCSRQNLTCHLHVTAAII